MPTFAILNRDPNQKLSVILPRKYPGDSYVWSESVGFVRAKGTANDVANHLDIIRRQDEGANTGTLGQMVVVETSPNYWGWTEKPLWEWLKSAFETAR